MLVSLLISSGVDLASSVAVDGVLLFHAISEVSRNVSIFFGMLFSHFCTFVLLICGCVFADQCECQFGPPLAAPLFLSKLYNMVYSDFRVRPAVQRRMNVQKVRNQDAEKYRAIATHLGNRKEQGRGTGQQVGGQMDTHTDWQRHIRK